MRTCVAVLTTIMLLGSGCALLAQNYPTRNLISTGITGSVTGSGLDNPQYVLSFIPVQRLVLSATQRPLTAAEIQNAVQAHR